MCSHIHAVYRYCMFLHISLNTIINILNRSTSGLENIQCGKGRQENSGPYRQLWRSFPKTGQLRKGDSTSMGR